MSVIVLPTRRDLPHYTFEIDLDGKTFGFEFRWNTRDEAWRFSISDASGEVLLAGRKVVLGFPLIVRFRDPRLPAGDLSAIDTSGQDKESGLEDLGSRVKLLYTPNADLPAELKG
jgi:hypothetical protein